MRSIFMFGPVPPPVGGIASVLQDIVASDLALDFAFVVHPRPEQYPAGFNSTLGRNLVKLWRMGGFFCALRRREYLLAHIHASSETTLQTGAYLLLARLAGVPALLHLHGTSWDVFYVHRSPLRRYLLRKVLSLPKAVVVLYEAWAERLRALDLPADIRVLPNYLPLTPAPSAEALARVRSRLALDPGVFLVCTVGSLGKRKGHFDIVEVIPRICAQDDSIRFVFAGEEEFPGELARLQALVEDKGIGGKVLFLGQTPREEVPALLACSDVFLLPSHREGMPVSLLEAMRAGAPIVTCPIGGIPDMLNERSALLIPPGAPQQIAEAVLRLRKAPDVGKALAAQAKIDFEHSFAFDRGSEKIREIYATFS